MITASCNGLASGTQVETINPGPPAKVAFTSSPFTAPQGTSATTPFTVSLEDQFGNLTTNGSNKTVNLSSSSGTAKFATTSGGAASATLALTFGANSSSVSAYYGDNTVGSPTLTATATGLTTATQIESIVLAPAKIVFTTNPRTGSAAANANLGPITVQEQSSGGIPTTVPETVNLTTTSGNGLFSLTQGGTTPITSVTIPAGTSSATFYYGDTTAGHPTLTAATTGLTSGTQSETVNPGPLSTFALSTPGPTAGTSFTETITATDAFGNPITSFTGPQTLAFSGPASSPNNTAPSYPANVTFTNGAGTATITLYDAQNTALTVAAGAISGTSATFSVNPAATTKFALPTPSSVTAGSQFTENISATDLYGNVASNYNGNQCITFSGPASSPGGNAPRYPGRGGGGGRCTTGVSQVNFNNGAGTAAITLYDAQTTTLTATQGTLTGSTGSFTVAGGSPASLAVSNPGTQAAGTAFSVTVTATDNYGNLASGTQNVTFSGPSNSPNNTVPSYPSSLTFNGAGQATASVTLYDAQSTTLTVQAAGGGSGTSTNFTVNAAPLSKLTLPTPGTQTAGTAFTQNISATDPYGNTATGFTGAQCITFSGLASSPGGTAPAYPAKGACASGSSLTFTNGAATASITPFAAQTGVTLTATAALITGSTGAFNVSNGPAAKFTIPTTPGTQTAGAPFSLGVTATDGYGNAFNGTVGVSFSGAANSPAPASRAPAYPTTLTFNNGSASASITLYDAQTNITLSVSATGVSAGTSGGFNVNPAATSQLLFTTQPAGPVGEGTAFTSQPLLTAQDPYNNVTPSFASAVTLNLNTYAAGNGGHNQGTLGCTTNPVTAVAGVATFAGCNITGNAAAGTYTFTGSGGSVTSAASNNVNIVAGTTATQLMFSTQPVGGVAEGTAFGTQPVLTAEDANGNTVTGFTSAVTLHVASYAAGSGGHTAGTIAGCTNPVTAVGGVATFSGCNITGAAAAGTYTFNATGGALTSAASNNVTITGGTATQLVFTTQPGGSVGEGTSFTTQPVLTAEDASGNTVTGFTNNVTLHVASYTASNGGHTAGNITGCTNPVAAVGGVATFSGCNITGAAAAGTYSLNATGGGLTSAASSNVTITPGAATQLLFSTQPVGGVTEGTAFGTQPVLTAEDTNGNTVTGFTSAVTLGINSYGAGNGGHNQGTLGCTTNPVTAVAGVATFAGCNITGAAAAGTYSLNATGGGLTSAASSNVTITSGAATQLLFSTQPVGGVTEATAFATQPVLTAQDTNGNVATGFTSAVTLNVNSYASGNGGHTQGSLAGCTNPVTAVAGVATFSGCDITGAAGAGTYTFNATGGGLTSGVSNNVSIVTGTATQLVFTTQPAGSVGEGSAFTTQPVLTAEDASGNTVGGFASAVTLSVNTYAAGTAATPRARWAAPPTRSPQ